MCYTVPPVLQKLHILLESLIRKLCILLAQYCTIHTTFWESRFALQMHCLDLSFFVNRQLNRDAASSVNA